MDNKIYSAYLITLNKQLSYVKSHGLPGLGHNKKGQESGPNTSGFFEFPEVEQLESQNDFLIKCPYAGSSVTVEVLFNTHEPWASPDFSFLDTDFMDKVTLEDLNNEVSCLNSWNYMSEDIVQRFLCQLIQLYKNYQLKMLEMQELLFYEYRLLLSTLEVTEEDVEFLMTSSGAYLASYLIKLPITFEDIPPVLLSGNPGSSETLLLINVRKSSGIIVPKMQLSSQVESLMGENKLDLPGVPAGSSISDYAENVLTRVRTSIKHTLNKFESRKQIIAQLLCTFGSALIEYDAQLFNKASFLISREDFQVIVIINISSIVEECRIVLRSVYSMNCVMSSVVKEACIEGRSPQDAVNSINDAIARSIQSFQIKCKEAMRKC